jgi:hypothetical protein
LKYAVRRDGALFIPGARNLSDNRTPTPQESIAEIAKSLSARYEEIIRLRQQLEEAQFFALVTNHASSTLH